MSPDASISALIAADPLWWLRDPAVPAHLCRAVARLRGTRNRDADRERVLRALTDALNREHVDFADDVVPGLDPSWPGREAFREWFVAHPNPSATGVRVLGALFPGDDLVRSLLTAGSPTVRGAAVRAHARPGAEALVREAAVTDPDASVRRHALEALVDTWPDEPGTREFLHERAVLDVGTEPRLFAVRTLARRWPREPGTNRLLADLARAERGTLVGSAAAGHIGDEPAWDDAAIRAALDDRWLGPVAVQALVSNHPDDPETFTTLVGLADHVHNDTRAAALDVLGAYRPHRPEARALLTGRAVADADHVVRRTALARTALTWPGEATSRLLRDRSTHDPHPAVRALAAQILAALDSSNTQ
ncbi:hypothetical protein [Cryptosporangium arvum]|uniref:hypothetical protein n=1 Tax=Cryptosporangium arvum TaxID=80871 RepID=UPI0004B9B444|nr:hypothetical protein [Cryptosporangium arvum]